MAFRQTRQIRPASRPQRHRPITPATAAGALSLILPAASLIRLYIIFGTLLPILYTLVVSGVAFMLYGYDKMQARNLEWRVKETTLHTFAIMGGWPGALAGMHYFQHKTRKRAFQGPFWVIVVGWQGVWWAIWSRGTFTIQTNFQRLYMNAEPPGISMQEERVNH